MSKYNAKLDLEKENSLSIMIDRIKPNSRILEFGPAHGRLTRYLKEELSCNVTIVELDEEAGKEASEFAMKSFIGEEQGDIEKYHWLEDDMQPFDYIIFADVLEHLYNPRKVLSKCNKILEDEGVILVSIPNIAHNSIIIGLLNDKFQYNSVGLLDNTHIKFFTSESFKELVSDLGYIVNSEFATYSEVGENEINARYSDVSLAIQKELKKRSLGKVYQYVFGIVKKKSAHMQNTSIKRIDTANELEMKIYIKNNGCSEFSEKQWIVQAYNEKDTEIQVDLKDFKEIQKIRIDPCEYKCILKLEGIFGEVNNERYKLEIDATNAERIVKDIYFFNTIDPQIVVKASQMIKDEIQKVIIKFKMVEYALEDFKGYKVLFDTMNQQNTQITKLEQYSADHLIYNKDLENELEKSKVYIGSLEEEQGKYKGYQEILETRVSEYETYQNELENKIKEHIKYQEEQEQRIEEYIRYQESQENRIAEYIKYQEEQEQRIEEHIRYQESQENRIAEYIKYQEQQEQRIKEYIKYQEEQEQRIEEHIRYQESQENRIAEYIKYQEQQEQRIKEYIKYQIELETKIEVYVNQEEVLHNQFQEKIRYEQELKDAQEQLLIKIREYLEIIEQQKQELNTKEEFITVIKQSKLFKLIKSKVH